MEDAEREAKMSAKTVFKIETPQDLEPLSTILSEIQGQMCIEVSVGFADELYLEFGKEIQVPIGGQIHARNEWRLASCGTAWKVETAGSVVISSQDSRELMEQKTAILENIQVREVYVIASSLALFIEFEHGYTFCIQPNEEDAECEFPYWELLTPDVRIIEVGPGHIWSYAPSNIV